MQGIYKGPAIRDEVRSLAAKEIMSYPVVTAKEKSSIMEIAKLMKKHGVDAVVITGKQGEPSGIITEGDIVRRLVSAKKNLWFVRAKHVMSKPLVAIDESTMIEDAAKYMAEKRVKKLCVLNGNKKLVGMITTEDITKNASYLINVLEEVIHTGYYMSVL